MVKCAKRADQGGTEHERSSVHVAVAVAVRNSAGALACSTERTHTAMHSCELAKQVRKMMHIRSARRQTCSSRPNRSKPMRSHNERQSVRKLRSARIRPMQGNRKSEASNEPAARRASSQSPSRSARSYRTPSVLRPRCAWRKSSNETRWKLRRVKGGEAWFVGRRRRPAATTPSHAGRCTPHSAQNVRTGQQQMQTLTRQTTRRTAASSVLSSGIFMRLVPERRSGSSPRSAAAAAAASLRAAAITAHQSQDQH